MTLRMGDGPPANIPAGLDAAAGYVDNSGIGITWPAVQTMSVRYHLSISVHGWPAMCGDVERGALGSWKGYTVGYCSISAAAALVARDGRPEKLWTAHYTGYAHICSSVCGYGFTGQADGTQWTDHGGLWDESLLLDDFFSFQGPQPNPQPEGEVLTVDLNPGKLAAPITCSYERPNHPGTGWRFGADGGVFPYGTPAPPMYGNPTGTKLAGAITCAVVAETGYTMIGSDGGTFSYGPGAPVVGSLA